MPFLGHFPDIAAKDITFFLHEVSQKYGPVAQVWLGARPWVLLSDPAAIRKVAYKSLARPMTSNSFSHMLVDEPDLVDAETDLWNRGIAWRASRQAFESSIMHPGRLATHQPAVRRCIDRFITQLKPYAANGEAVNMKEHYSTLSLAVTGEVAYGVDFWSEPGGGGAEGAAGGSKAAATELMRACHECMACLELNNATGYLLLQMVLPALRPLWRLLAKYLPDAAQRRHMRARQKVADASRSLMQQWQAAKRPAKNGNSDDGADAGDAGAAGGGRGRGSGSGFRETGGGISQSSFLAAMLEDRRRGCEANTGLPRMNDVQVIAQGLVFILAGYDTTSSSLANMTFLLATHQDVQDKLREELSANPACLDDMDVLAKLPYLDAVFRESQRLYPVGTFVWRDLRAEVDVGGGMFIPAGAFICLSIYNVHQDPSQWPEPERFLPERFLAETRGSLGPADPGAFIPFGVGPRACVGQRLATMTVKATLAALLLRYQVVLHPRQPLPFRLKTSITLSPVDGVWVSLTELK